MGAATSPGDSTLPPLAEAEIARLQAFPPLTRTTVPFLGRRLEITDAYWFLHGYQEIFVDEIYRFSTEASRALIFDCGANVGLSVIYFKARHPRARVIAFEPDPALFTVLDNNVRAWAVSDVTLYASAVWSEATRMPFEPDGCVGGRIMKTAAEGRTVDVETVRLRDFLSQDEDVDLLKIDVEGAEYDVLRDCRLHLHRVRRLFVEFHGERNAPQRLHEILGWLEEAGFRYHVKEAYPVAHPFLDAERERRFDLQLNLFAFRP